MAEFQNNFNSIKVRLKPEIKEKATTASTFQFHKGTIKTNNSHIYWRFFSEFQFHKGTIKTYREIHPLQLRI